MLLVRCLSYCEVYFNFTFGFPNIQIFNRMFAVSVYGIRLAHFRYKIPLQSRNAYFPVVDIVNLVT